MSLRTALREARIVTVAILVATLWTVLTILDIAGQFNWMAFDTSAYVGRTAVGGVVGLLVLIAFLGLLVGLYSEVTEADPAPETWPPQ
ncbi:hypothetical protein [Halobellus sp. EA9]|uniref:hypothetical protein n=1 Tax=Halobellus sp. EA9 TaxID=3421647 RepID=UPI003EB6CCF6